MNSSPAPRFVRRPARLHPRRVVLDCNHGVPPLRMQRPLFPEGETGVGKTENRVDTLPHSDGDSSGGHVPRAAVT